MNKNATPGSIPNRSFLGERASKLDDVEPQGRPVAGVVTLSRRVSTNKLQVKHMIRSRVLDNRRTLERMVFRDIPLRAGILSDTSVSMGSTLLLNRDRALRYNPKLVLDRVSILMHSIAQKL